MDEGTQNPVGGAPVGDEQKKPMDGGMPPEGASPVTPAEPQQM